MKYNQPYGIVDPNAPYINGDPSIGRAGSIPPAESIEYDQREVVAVIKYAYDNGFFDYANALCAAPSNADLTQLLKAIFGIMNSLRLTAPRTYYVNPSTGLDTNDGKAIGTPFQTLNRAAKEAARFNLNGFTVTIVCANGLYTQCILPPVNGSGVVAFVGNLVTPSNCTVHAATGPAVHCAGQGYTFEGFRFESDATDLPGARPGAGVWSVPGGLINLGGCEYGFCADAHVAAFKGTLTMTGIIRVVGNSNAHMSVTNNGVLYCTGNPFPQLVIPGAITVGDWAQCGNNSVEIAQYSSISGGANVTGRRYNAFSNGIIDTFAHGPTYLPGTVAGVTSTGGQYV